MANRRLLGERVAVRVAGCPTRDGVLISGVKKQTKLIQKFHVRFPNGDVRTHRGDQILLRGSKAPFTEYLRVGDIIFTKNTLGVVRFVGKHEEFLDLVIVLEPMDPKLPTDPNVGSFRNLFPSANLSDQNPYTIVTKADDILKMLPPDIILKQLSTIKDKYVAFAKHRKQQEEENSYEIMHADSRIVQLEDIHAQLKERIQQLWLDCGPTPEKVKQEMQTATPESSSEIIEDSRPPTLKSMKDIWGQDENAPRATSRPGVTPELKEQYEQEIRELHVKIEESQELVTALKIKNTKLEEDHTELTRLRVKSQSLRNSRMLFQNQIKAIRTRGKDWRKKAMVFEKMYEKLLDERGTVEAKNNEHKKWAASSPGAEREMNSTGQKNLEQNQKRVKPKSRPRKSTKMPMPEPGNTLSLKGLSDKSKKKKRRPTWFKKEKA